MDTAWSLFSEWHNADESTPISAIAGAGTATTPTTVQPLPGPKDNEAEPPAAEPRAKAKAQGKAGAKGRAKAKATAGGAAGGAVGGTAGGAGGTPIKRESRANLADGSVQQLLKDACTLKVDYLRIENKARLLLEQIQNDKDFDALNNPQNGGQLQIAFDKLLQDRNSFDKEFLLQDMNRVKAKYTPDQLMKHVKQFLKLDPKPLQSLTETLLRRHVA